MRSHIKLFLTIGLCFLFSSSFAISNLLLNNAGDFVESHHYSIKLLKGTNYNTAPMVYYGGNTYVANGSKQPTFESAPDIDSAWDALSVESLPGTLTNAHIFVGNASNVPADVAVSGAITISNTGVASLTGSSVFTGTAATNTNVILGTQSRNGSASFGAISSGAESVVTVTYASACSTAAYAVVLTPLEATSGLPITVKLRSQTASGFVAAVQNAGATTSAAGTLFYTVTCH